MRRFVVRLAVVLVVAVMLLPSLASAGTSREPRDALAVSVTRVAGKGVYVSWTPAPGAEMYEVYRGPSLDALQLVKQVATIEFADFGAPNVDLWYEIVSIHPTASFENDLGPMRGRCMAMRNAGISITLAHCMPAETPLGPGPSST